MVGCLAGCLDSGLEGESLGLDVGFFEGISVGGGFVGLVVGPSYGCFVGFLEGPSVGRIVGHQEVYVTILAPRG